MKNYERVISEVLAGAKQATFYLSENCTIKATFSSKCKRREIVVLTVGRPNYSERKFIALCKKAGEKFPIKKIQLKWHKPK